MKVLVTYGSKMGGSREIADTVGQGLVNHGLSVEVTPAEKSPAVSGYDAVVVGSGLYASRWRRPARRFVKRNAGQLRSLPVWFFSSGPLDDSATTDDIPPVKQVAALMELVDSDRHKTFGGRLPADAKGFPASAMAKKNAGDWRDQHDIRSWADEIAIALTSPAAPAKG